MKFDFKSIVIIALLLLIVAGVLLWPKKEDSATVIKANDSIETINQENRILKMSVRTLELTIQDTNVKKKADSARFYREITVKNQQLAIKRVQIDTVFKDSPVLQDYLRTADSVFAMMRTRIDTLEQYIKFREGLYTDLIRIKDKQIQNLTYISTQQNVIIADQEKALRKRGRGNKLLKAAAVVLPVAGLLLGSQL